MSQDKPSTLSVGQIITKLGGLSVVAKALGHRNVTTVQGWVDRGVIPARRQREVLELAESVGFDIGPDDLIPTHSPSEAINKIFSVWPTSAALAREIGVHEVTVRKWKSRVGAIPVKYWKLIQEAARIKGVDIAIEAFSECCIANLTSEKIAKRRGIEFSGHYHTDANGNTYHGTSDDWDKAFQIIIDRRLDENQHDRRDNNNDLLRAVLILRAMTDDYAVSKRHHPNHVLVSKEAFDDACALIKEIDGRAGQ